MSDLGPSSHASAPEPREPTSTNARTPRQRRALRVVIAAIVVLGLVAGTGAFFLRSDDATSYPDQWDARIKPYVDIVEEERGLTFKHPVKVRFLDKDAFEKTVRTDKKDLDKDEREDIRETESLFRAFGLISGDVDLFDAFNDASGSGTLAYYSFDNRSITVRGTKLALASRATLVHELTHALQDQRFDIADRLKKLGKRAEDGAPTTEPDALRAIVEGDAERVANLYRMSLTKKKRKAMQKAEAADSGDSLEEMKGIPKVVLTLLGAPYALGQAVTEAVAAQDADDVDGLFENPPPDDSVLLDPLKALGDMGDAVDVKIPTVGSGEKKFDSGQVGALVTYLILAERIPLKEALTATDTWTGDAYLGFKRDDVVCARVSYATESGSAALLTTAFEDWIDAAPGSTATVERSGNQVIFESCDPGKDAELTNDASTKALELVATRGYVGAGIIQAGAPAPVARCFARRMIEEYSVADLTDPRFGADDPEFAKRIQGFAADCR
ncbi:hypothetical protein [Aeromicrobium sp.]|uniref:hypothetical protein n=1 Tax=Aeromicrobium sp. TaxID=1871063 RepID=UPI0030BA5234